MSGWRAVGRIALRELRGRRLSALVCVVVVALPVSLGVAAAEVAHNTPSTGEQRARNEMGLADALLEVTPFSAVNPRYEGDSLVGDRAKGAQRRSPNGVDVAHLLPPGTRFTPAPAEGTALLDSGGVATVLAVAADSPLTSGIVSIKSGRAPRAADEVAVSVPMAAELHLASASGRVDTNAKLELANGLALRVVGLLGDRASFGRNVGGARIVVAPNSQLHVGSKRPPRFLVGFASGRTSDLGPLVRDLAASGILVKPRDVYFHPARWGAQLPSAAAVDTRAAWVGTLVIAAGLVEVALLIGAIFLISARRRARELALLAANGASPRHLRCLVVAQGLLLGVVGAVMGAGFGVGLFFAILPLYEDLASKVVWRHDLDALSIVLMAVLGVISALIASLAPAWSVSRMTVVDGLRGTYRSAVKGHGLAAARTRILRALAPAGLIGLVGAGYWASQTARGPSGTYTGGGPGPAIAVAAVSAFVLLAGALAWFPVALRWLGLRVENAPLPARFAIRDTARGVVRTVASVTALGLMVSTAIVGLFVIDSVRIHARQSMGTANSLSVDLGEVAGSKRGFAATQVSETVRHVVGSLAPPAQGLTASVPGRHGSPASLELIGGAADYVDITIVDAATLRYLLQPALSAGQTRAMVSLLEHGGIISTVPGTVNGGRSSLALYPRPKARNHRWALPAKFVRTSRQFGAYGQAWLAPTTARKLGFDAIPQVATYLTRHPVTQDQLDRLAVYGLSAGSPDIESARLRVARLAGLVGLTLTAFLVLLLSLSMALAEGRADFRTLMAVGGAPQTARRLQTWLGVTLSGYGTLLGVAVGIAAGVSLEQADGLAGISVPWLSIAATVVAVPALGGLIGRFTRPPRILTPSQDA